MLKILFEGYRTHIRNTNITCGFCVTIRLCYSIVIASKRHSSIRLPAVITLCQQVSRAQAPNQLCRSPVCLTIVVSSASFLTIVIPRPATTFRILRRKNTNVMTTESQQTLFALLSSLWNHNPATPPGRSPVIWWFHCRVLNSMAPGEFEWNFRYVIFKRILVIVGWGISCGIALIWMSMDFVNDQSSLVQVMAWCRQATSHYLGQCWPRSMSSYGVIRPHWVINSQTVNSLGPEQ